MMARMLGKYTAGCLCRDCSGGGSTRWRKRVEAREVRREIRADIESLPPGEGFPLSRGPDVSVADWPKWADMTWLRLLEGPGNMVVLPVAPTMKSIRYAGERYFRMKDSRSTNDAGEYGGLYLWDGWWPAKIAAMEAAEIETIPPADS